MTTIIKWYYQLNFKLLFNNLTNKDKILTFLLVPTLLYLVFVVINNSFVNTPIHSNNSEEIKQITKSIKQLSKKPTINHITLIKHIENISLNINVKIVNLKISNKLFEIQATGNFQNIINFIYNLEKDMTLTSLQLIKSNDKSILMNSSFKLFKSSLNTQIQNVENLANPFIGIREYNFYKQRQLNAIVGQNVSIDDKWYIKNDMIGKYKLTKITTQYVILKYKNNKIKLELLKDDN